jgi:hypothetical protein
MVVIIVLTSSMRCLAVSKLLAGCPSTPVRSLNVRRGSDGPKSASVEDVLSCHDSEVVS